MDISDRSLREIYLKPYERAVEANVFTVMAAHNGVNEFRLICIKIY